MPPRPRNQPLSLQIEQKIKRLTLKSDRYDGGVNRAAETSRAGVGESHIQPRQKKGEKMPCEIIQFISNVPIRISFPSYSSDTTMDDVSGVGK